MTAAAMAEERWRPIPAYPLLGVPAGYEASSEGRVRSVSRTLAHGRPAGGVVLKQQRDKDGYLMVGLGRKRVRVQMAVALAFHGKPEVMHLNDVRDDNRPENLAWGSHWLNMQGVKRAKEEAKEVDENGGSLPHSAKTPARTGLISLSEAVSLRVVSGSLAALRKASQRDPLFPPVQSMNGLTKMYDGRELIRWQNLRRRTQLRRIR
jgi:hypothetical protein